MILLFTRITNNQMNDKKNALERHYGIEMQKLLKEKHSTSGKLSGIENEQLDKEIEVFPHLLILS